MHSSLYALNVSNIDWPIKCCHPLCTYFATSRALQVGHESISQTIPTPFAHHATTISSQTFWTGGMATASTLMHPYWSSIPKCIDTIVQPYFTRKSWTYIQDWRNSPYLAPLLHTSSPHLFITLPLSSSHLHFKLAWCTFWCILPLPIVSLPHFTNCNFWTLHMWDENVPLLQFQRKKTP
jgi:hypothetical protein